MTKNGARIAGKLLHAKHSFMPNNLGYCGPDDSGKILDHLRASSSSDTLVSILRRFEAAYPFVRMIAKSNGMDPFDYEVAEAYWIGNPLLERVTPMDFFEFMYQTLKSPLPKDGAKAMFKELGGIAKPHHTFYVLGLYGRPIPSSSNKEKLLQLMDSCRISWGKVIGAKEKELLIERRPLSFANEHLTLAKPVRLNVAYDKDIAPFDTIKNGDWVSVHWNFASEKLTRVQLGNLRHYTVKDIKATNLFANLLCNTKQSKNTF